MNLRREREGGFDGDNAHLAGIFENLEDAVASIDLNGIIRYWNRGAEKLLGYSAQEMVGEHFHKIVPPERREEVEEKRMEAIEKGSVRFETMRLSKTRERIPVDLTISAVKDPEGKVTGTSGVMKDITARKRSEEELHEHADRLQRSNKLKDLALDIMTHELLNQLTVINGWMALAERPLKTSRVLQAIKECADRMLEMIENLVVLNRLEDIRCQMFEETKFSVVVKEAVEDVSTSAKEKEIGIETDLVECTLNANPFIKAVVTNLLTNAVKYSPSGSQVVVKLRQEGERCKLLVKDWGEGVPDENKEKIFERFERGGKEGIKGTGLGLAIVKRIVELYHGRVWVEDNPGGGSVFVVELPEG